MASTILATFDSVEHAQEAIRDLTEAGFDRNDIGLAVYDPNKVTDAYMDGDVTGGEGAGFGAVVGSMVGAVAGLTAIVIPGIGPIVAAGPLAAALGALTGAGIGAASGALAGDITASLVRLGVPTDDTHYYAESLRRGAALVSVSAHDFDTQRATYILQSHNPINIDQRVAQWRKQGWVGFDPMVDPYTSEQLARMRSEDTDFPMNDEEEDYEEYADSVRNYPRD